MSDAVLIALAGGGGGGLTALSAVLVAWINRKKIRPLEASTAAIAAQVTHNGGTSMKDGVDRIEKSVAEVIRIQGEHGERLARLEGRLDERRA